jgi:hypothetical protein
MLPAGKVRHQEDRFEWTRSEFRRWANELAQSFGYSVRFLPFGLEDPLLGSPVQMEIFTESNDGSSA